MELISIASNLFLFLLVLFLRKCSAQGFDAGDADPLKFGLIDPLALEIASTYVFIVPFVIFVFGILAIPTVLVITFLIVVPFLIPTSSSERRSFDGVRMTGNGNTIGGTVLDSVTSMFSKSYCLNRILCEINLSRMDKSTLQNINSTENVQSSRRKPRKRKIFNTRTSCDRYSCNIYDTVSSFATAMNFLRK